MEQQSMSLMRDLGRAFPTGWAAAACLVVALYVYSVATWVPKPARSSLKLCPTQQTSSSEEGVRLRNITAQRDKSNTDIDIVAIHGLDTKSPNTWTFKSKDGKPDVNWLADSDMLPSQMDRARILTCDWPASLFQPSALTSKTVGDYTRPLLAGIKRELLEDDHLEREPRPILFIASCLGGVILSAALVKAASADSDYHRIFRATRGIVFLATPFRATSFKDVANWAEVALRFHASSTDRKLTTLMVHAKETDPVIIEDFTRLYRGKENPLELVSFCEGKTTSLPRKAFPWLSLPRRLCREKLLVDEGSAHLDIVTNRLRLDRCHSLMNKFSGPDCADYVTVAGEIKAAAANILRGTLLKQADDYIRTNCYPEATQITRLSGAPLPMDQCYINLTLVEADRAGEVKHYSFDTAPHERVMVMKVSLSTLFNDRDGKLPRRIMIRGSAGVGKTTLCKKIVYDFHYGTSTELHRLWTKLFDRVLWIPLRNLKEESVLNFNKLFCHEFFSVPQERQDLADHLAALLPIISSRTLFLLDGLDEILPDLHIGEKRFRFLEELLGQQNVIVTSRPSANLPDRLGPPDLALETIGFYPQQVEEYIKSTFSSFSSSSDGDAAGQRVASILKLLDKHKLLQTLVRIPIQLDALCYTWDEEQDAEQAGPLDTMTAIYTALEKKLWRKDAVRMGKKARGTPVTASDVATGVTGLISDERQFLELLAFSGLDGNKIEFSSIDWERIASHLNCREFLPSRQLLQISFLRTTDRNRESGPCHFIHLTFQEYFAARYFVRKWTAPDAELELVGRGRAKTLLVNPREYLRKHKYTPRYNVFWRFVAGLFDQEHQASLVSFIDTLEQEPLDLLGPTHQRLVMYCLVEISSTLEIRRRLRKKLTQWLLLSAAWAYEPFPLTLASEAEFPEEALNDAIKQSTPCSPTQGRIVTSLNMRIIPESTMELISPWIHRDHPNLMSALTALCGVTPLSDAVLTAVVMQLHHDEDTIRNLAAEVLSWRPSLPCEIADAIAKHLDGQDSHVCNALQALSRKSSLPHQVVSRVAMFMTHKYDEVRKNSIKTLKSLDPMPPAILAAMEARLDDISWFIAVDAFHALCEHPCLPLEIVQGIAARFDRGDPNFLSNSWRVLPPNLLAALVERLDVGEWIMWKRTSELLARQPGLPPEILSGIALRLHDDDYHVRVRAIRTLDHVSSLPEELLLKVAARLHDTNDDVRSAAVNALVPRPDLSKHVRGELTAALDDEAFCVRAAIAGALPEKLSLPQRAVQGIARYIGADVAPELREAAMTALSWQQELPDETLAGMVANLRDEKWSIRSVALEALSRTSVFSVNSELSNVVWESMRDDSGDCRIFHLLCKLPKIPDDLLAEMATRLHGDCQSMAVHALEGLCRQSVLPETVLSLVSSGLGRFLNATYQAGHLVDALQNHLHDSFFPCILNSPHATAILKPLVQVAVEAPVSVYPSLSFYIEDGEFCFNLDDGVRRLPIGSGNPNVVRDLRSALPRDLPAGAGVLVAEDGKE
ncbi:ankyrin repeat-containing domain [Cordyceps militaris]|uniref:Ankyrin repeat-containing domain n=1 Tax=Cordyceps militaris TaxID=73501 RepID=A0A2H4S812_CORMI|nr:ankyrin repeat-containing domain [Cordyceps militaris]